MPLSSLLRVSCQRLARGVSKTKVCTNVASVDTVVIIVNIINSTGSAVDLKDNSPGMSERNVLN